MWLTPYGFRDQNGVCARPSDYDDIVGILKSIEFPILFIFLKYYVAEKTIQAIQATHGTSWIYGATCETLCEFKIY